MMTVQLMAARNYFPEYNLMKQLTQARSHGLVQWFPTFLRLGSTHKSKTNLGSPMMAYTNFWKRLLVSSWEQFQENSRHLGIFGST
jgi:hypothetical protein